MKTMTDYRYHIKAKVAALDEERLRLYATLGLLDEIDSDELHAVLSLPASQQRAAYLKTTMGNTGQSQSGGEES